MKRLTEQEIEFIKCTGWTPTLHQMEYSENELKRTRLYQSLPGSSEMMRIQFANFANIYGFNLLDLYNKTCSLDSADSISLEEEAIYLFYTFFTKDELVDIDDAYALKWLKDFKYYYGFRKWSEYEAEKAVLDALEVYSGTRTFAEDDNGEIYSCPAICNSSVDFTNVFDSDKDTTELREIQIGVNTVFKLKKPIQVPCNLTGNSLLMYVVCELLGLEKKVVHK